MKFLPYDSEEFRNTVNLQELSQLVQLQRKDFEVLQLGEYESNITTLRTLMRLNEVTPSPIFFMSNEELLKEMEELSKNPEFVSLFGDYDIEKKQLEALDFFKQHFRKIDEMDIQRLAETKVDQNGKWIIPPRFDSKINNPAWPIHYTISDGSIRYYPDKECIVISESSDELKIEGGFNYLSFYEVSVDNRLFDYFFTLKLLLNSVGPISQIEGFLEYQLVNNFNGDIKGFSMFLIKAVAEHFTMNLPPFLTDFIRNWIMLKQSYSHLRNLPQPVGPLKTDGSNNSPLSLPDFIGDDWENFKSGFIELIQNHAKTRTSTRVFQQVMYGLWRYRTIPDKRWTQVIHVARAFIEHFSKQLNVDEDSLRRYATSYKEVTNKTSTFDIERPFDEFCLKFCNKEEYSSQS